MNAGSIGYARIARWLFAIVIFAYLWWQGGYWRYVAYAGFAFLATFVVLFAISSKSARR